VPVVQLHAFRGDSSFPIRICFGKRWSLVWEQGGRWGEFGVSHGQLFMSAYMSPFLGFPALLNPAIGCHAHRDQIRRITA
jgi:hypothetical protein